MLVSHRRRFIYVKTRKTAGTSVEIYFEPFCLDPASTAGLRQGRPESVSEHGIVGLRGVGARHSGQRFFNHMSASAIRDAIGQETWSAYLKFCVVRNPFDKMVSYWWFQMSPAERDATARKDFREVGSLFQDFVKTCVFQSDEPLLFLDGRPCMDFVIRYERLLADLERCCAMLDVPFEPGRLGSFKRGMRLREEPFWDYYDDEASAAVASALAPEIALLGYANGPSGQSGRAAADPFQSDV